jgi:uncharacterized membrane protein
MNRRTLRPGSRAPRGVASYYLVICMVALCGICSLGVDLGRVQLVKTELRRAADAASRAGASGLPDVAQAISLASQYAQLNNADASPVALDATDIELGTWNKTNKTFTVLTGAARSGANAVRVTARRPRRAATPRRCSSQGRRRQLPATCRPSRSPRSPRRCRRPESSASTASR